jgi:hypothetical protein
MIGQDLDQVFRAMIASDYLRALPDESVYTPLPVPVPTAQWLAPLTGYKSGVSLSVPPPRV